MMHKVLRLGRIVVALCVLFVVPSLTSSMVIISIASLVGGIVVFSGHYINCVRTKDERVYDI
jgi:hypothetical protein